MRLVEDRIPGGWLFLCPSGVYSLFGEGVDEERHAAPVGRACATCSQGHRKGMDNDSCE